jgi:hypothetical protein
MFMTQRFIKNKGASPNREGLNFFEVQTCKYSHLKALQLGCCDKTAIVRFSELNRIITPLSQQYIGKE